LEARERQQKTILKLKEAGIAQGARAELAELDARKK
jgi:hypothetical protein